MFLLIFYAMKKFTFLTIFWNVLIMGVSPIIFYSCSDEDSFTADRNSVLEFSQDTIAFDTVFTGITTPTERFYVYNKNDKGVRIASVKLEKGGTSGFLINVDGQNGTNINDVQVLKKDSIFVFVKLSTTTFRF